MPAAAKLEAEWEVHARALVRLRLHRQVVRALEMAQPARSLAHEIAADLVPANVRLAEVISVFAKKLISTSGFGPVTGN